MKHKNFLFLLFFSFCISTGAQESAFFRLEVGLDQSLSQDESLFLRGDHIFMGMWQKNQVRLAKKNDTTWTGMFIMQKNESVRFLIDHNETTISDTIALEITSDTLIQLQLESDKDVQGFLKKGNFHFLPNTVEGRLIDRKVTVRTPIDYRKDTSTYYPTLYILDGQYVLGEEKSNPNHWLLKNTLDSLENANAIQPFILVAVEHNFQNRSMEFADTDLGQRHIHYLCEELTKKIDLLFRTEKSPDHRYLCGAVAGGFATTHTALSCPDKFGHVLTLSPAYVIHENNMIETIKNDSIQSAQTNFYIDTGEFEMDEKLKPGIDSTANFFRNLGCQVKENFTPNSIPNGENFRYRVIDGILHFFSRNTP